jgi:hypothetical protein
LLTLFGPDEITAALAATDPTGESSPTLDELRADPCLPMAAAGWDPDPWQGRFLATDHPRQALLCCRRAGKSAASAAKTLGHCLTRPDALALVFSPTLRQSIEYARYVRRYDRALGHPVPVERINLTTVEWANGSRLMSMPDSHEGVVGFTPTRIVIDEASRVSDILYLSLRPMLALGAELELLSTPFGKRGFFFEVFDTPARLKLFRSWRVTADDCPRIRSDFLAEERLELGERWYRQEYYLAFNDAVDAVFSQDAIAGAVRPTAELPWFGSEG